MRIAQAADAAAVHALIAHFAEQGLLLPRTPENVRADISHFIVIENNSRIAGCVALEPYGPDLAEIRSLAVDPQIQGKRLGARLLRYALTMAKRRRIARVFAVTHAPHFFGKHGFVAAASRWAVPEKIARDCCTCPKAKHCELVAVVATVIPERVVLPVLAEAKPAPAL